ncbi:MAG TPA: nuclear transport factor 2 family protein [Planctomycetota bacterium]|nr:nuclear transport factor 2 family protein [Planctomycetota bacterium]
MSGRARQSRSAAGALGLLTVLAAVLAGGASTPTSERAQKNPTAVGTVEAEVEAFLAYYVETLESRDEAAVRELFVSDGRLAWFTDGALSYTSADEVLEGMRRYGDVRFETKLSDVRAIPFGPGRAIASSSFRTDLSLEGGGSHAYGGVITWVLERLDPDAGRGPWRVLAGHTSTPGGPPRSDEAGR